MTDKTCTEPDCSRPWMARGLCSRCYKRHRRLGTLAAVPKTRTLWVPEPPASPIPLEYGSPVLPDRIWSRLALADGGCWEWTGQRLKGYGQINAGRRTWYTHRLVYTVFVGAIPEGHDLDHYRWPDNGCIGRPCALHTRPVTRRENILRAGGFSSWNLAKEHCPQGHPYAGENLYLNKLGYRDCKICRRARKTKAWVTKRQPSPAPSQSAAPGQEPRRA